LTEKHQGGCEILIEIKKENFLATPQEGGMDWGETQIKASVAGLIGGYAREKKIKGGPKGGK